jgi:hypothetical protein
MLSASPAEAEPAESHPVTDGHAASKPHTVTDVVVLRGAETLQSPHRVGYRLIEWDQQRGRWIAPDIGYYDTGYGQSQLWFIGAGAELLHRPHFVWTEELYATQAAGPEARNERSLWFWTVFDLPLRKRLSAQIVTYPTLPLNKSQSWGFDIDRAKLEWNAGSNWKVGPGYSATTCAPGTAWLSRPFLTVTRKSRTGDYEVWLERISGGAQVQFRYLLVRDEK